MDQRSWTTLSRGHSMGLILGGSNLMLKCRVILRDFPGKIGALFGLIIFHDAWDSREYPPKKKMLLHSE